MGKNRPVLVRWGDLASCDAHDACLLAYPSWVDAWDDVHDVLWEKNGTCPRPRRKASIMSISSEGWQSARRGGERSWSVHCCKPGSLLGSLRVSQPKNWSDEVKESSFPPKILWPKGILCHLSPRKSQFFISPALSATLNRPRTVPCFSLEDRGEKRPDLTWGLGTLGGGRGRLFLGTLRGRFRGLFLSG